MCNECVGVLYVNECVGVVCVDECVRVARVTSVWEWCL